MGLALVVGCGLIALGPSAMLWMFVVGKRPALVIVAIVSAFFWLASIALASLVWTMLPPVQDMWLWTLFTGVVIQGYGRLVLARLYIKTERVIDEVQARGRDENGDREIRTGERAVGINSGRATEHDGERSSQLVLNGLSSSIAAGVGWGAMHAVVRVGTALAKHTGAGAAFSPSCPRVPSVIVTAFSAQAFVWLDLLLVAMAFAYLRSGEMRLMVCSFGFHFLGAISTGFNFIDGGCVASLPLLYGVVALSLFAAQSFGLFTSAAHGVSPRSQ